MKAAVYYSPGDVRIEDRPVPRRTDVNIIIKVKCCAICGSDLKLYNTGNPRCHPPRIIGHEMVGRIVHVGKTAGNFAVGERVTLATTVGCGKCHYCIAGLGNLCMDPSAISNSIDGAFAEFLEVPPQAIAGGNVIKVPDSVTDEAAALSEPLSCAINGQEIAGVKEGVSVLIFGGGPLGVIHAGLAAALGAKDVMVVEKSEKRLSLLSGFKDIFVIDSIKEDIETVVKGRTKGLGADVAIVCAPVREAHEQAVGCVRKGGAVSFFASIPKGMSDIKLDSRIIHYGELRITGVSDSRPEHVAKAVQLMEKGKLDMGAYITHRISLDDFHKGIGLMKSGDSLKILVYPEGVEK